MSWFNTKRNQRLHRQDLRRLDTRIRTRIKNQRRLRMVGWGTGGVLLVGAVIWGCWWGVRESVHKMFSENPVYQITEISVENTGDSLKPEEVQGFLGVQKGQNLLSIDLAELRKKLELQPMVEKTEIARELPGKLSIHITERIPIANISLTANTSYQVDRNGVIISYPRISDDLQKQLSALPSIVGAKISDLKIGRVTSSPEILQALVLIQKVENIDFGSAFEIQYVDVSKHNYLILRTQEHSSIKIGLLDTDPSMDQQLWRLARILTTARNDPVARSRQIEAADLSVKNDVPVVWAQGQP